MVLFIDHPENLYSVSLALQQTREGKIIYALVAIKESVEIFLRLHHKDRG